MTATAQTTGAPTTGAPTFADLAACHGQPLAYIARQSRYTTVPADPAAATPEELLQLTRDAVEVLNGHRFWELAGEMEEGPVLHLTHAVKAQGDAQAVLLEGADEKLRDLARDAANAVAHAVGGPRQF
ncbi:hypothetical protein ACFV1L_22040 [Kitasatospora sp. NPDC059646]|uniref:hypothetical protein n=1 Tax=Kitasatospora sp. NPDC059646 TaxID=3346893 RepID=UPI0036D05EDC